MKLKPSVLHFKLVFLVDLVNQALYHRYSIFFPAFSTLEQSACMAELNAIMQDCILWHFALRCCVLSVAFSCQSDHVFTIAEL